MVMYFACPCCGYKTLSEKPNGTFEICPVCFWEDDNVQLNDPYFKGGANHVSLSEAQKNYQLFGASRKEMIKNVRLPKEDEPRESGWKFLDE